MQQISRREVVASVLAAGVGGAERASLRGAADKPGRTAAPAPKRDWWDKPFHLLVTLGESTTAGGWASCRERSWANQLARLINEFQRIPVQLANVGIGGNVL